MTAAENTRPVDLGTARGLSDTTLTLCNVRPVDRRHAFGEGWLWDTYTLEGVRAERWKSVHSTRPINSPHWAKYRWHPEKPAGNAGYFDPDGTLKEAVKNAFGCLFLVGGEIAAMSMFEAGFRHTTCFFGDEAVPHETLLDDLRALGVETLFMIPDRDQAGQRCAVTVRDTLGKALDIDFTCFALPYELVEKHGKDVNDYWLDLKQDRDSFEDAIEKLPTWHLPEPRPSVIEFPRLDTGHDFPTRFVDDVLQDVQRRAPPHKAFRWRGNGWSTNFRCPFHDDQEASAGFNKESLSFKCFVCGSKGIVEYGEEVGIRLRDYRDTPIPKVETPAAPPPKPKPKPRLLMPALPAFAQLSDAEISAAAGARLWLDHYVKWATEMSPLTPPCFHEAIALWLLATVSTRRIHVQIGADDIYPNLYLLIVARTTIYRKTTAMKLAKMVLDKANLSALLLPGEATPEALFDELAGVKPPNFDALSEDTRRRWLLGRSVAAQRSIMRDEASSIFASMKRDYMAGLSELLLKGYDGDTGAMEKRLKSRGLITVRDLCISFLGATTPVMFAKHVGNEEHENGFIARFAIITPDSETDYQYPGDSIDVPPALITRLRHMFINVLPWHEGQKPGWTQGMIGDVITPPTVSVLFASDAMTQLNEYRRALTYDMIKAETIDDGKIASYSRLGTMAFKVAMLLAAIDTEALPIRVEPKHAYAAQLITEGWRESLHRLDQDLTRSSGVTLDEKVLNLIRASDGNGVTIREIMRECGVKTRSWAIDILSTLHDDGLIEKFESKPARGRPTVRYRLPQD